MSKLKEKSIFNIEASKVLLNVQFFAPSVHCSYYSCFQLMKYKIKHVLKIDYEELSKRIASSNLRTHNYVIKIISDEIKSRHGNREFRIFSNKIKDLKLFRENSDYEDFEIDISYSNKAYLMALEVLKQIKKI